MGFSKARQSLWRLFVALLLIGVFSLAGLGAQRASAAPANKHIATHPLVGCAPCISSLTPPQNGTVTADASGKVTLQFAAQMTANFVQFVLTIDGNTVDNAQIQVTSNDPLNPAGQYSAALTPGQHTATVEVDDANGAESTFTGWTFTVQSSQSPTPTPTKKPSGGSGGGGSGSTPGTTSGSGILAPRTLSIILFSIAGLGLLVMAFIAGMWFSGRRALRNEP
jgi:hypothetical protein